MPELKFKQIACSEAMNSSGDYNISLYGLTEEGVVYQLNETKEHRGWHKLNMQEYLPPNKPKNG